MGIQALKTSPLFYSWFSLEMDAQEETPMNLAGSGWDFLFLFFGLVVKAEIFL